MRPTRLEEFLGQEHLLGPGKALGELIRRGDVGPGIFWGPPGPGKTTLARRMPNAPTRHFQRGAIVRRAIEQTGWEMGDAGCVSPEGVEALVAYAQGDARRVLNGLEAVLQHIHASRISHPASRDVVVSILERPLPAYDKSGEQHFNLISALHKAVRGSDVEGSLYWLGPMLLGGAGSLCVC